MTIQDWLVVVPLIEEPAVLQAALDAHDVKPDQLMYVDNTRDGAYRFEDKADVRNGTGTNWGVSRSWNVGIDEQHDWTLILSSSVVLPYGLRYALKQFDEVIEAGEEYIVFTEEALHAFAVSRKLIQTIGRFDENFFSYYEDTDFLYRLKVSKIKQPPWLPKIDLRAGSYQDKFIARALKRGLVKVDFGELKDYYVKKWGGPPSAEKFIRPFNDPSHDLRWWHPRAD